MRHDVLKFYNDNNSVKEFFDAVCQGVPSAVFGVNQSFKNYLVSIIEGNVLFVVKDNLVALNALNL